MRTTHLSLFLAALLWLGSCINEPLVEPGGGCGDGRATRVTLAVKGDSRERVQPGSRSLTPEQEGLIDNLHILVFDDAGDIITNEHFARLAIKGTGSVSFETLPGADRQIVVIANGDVNDDTNGELDAALRAVATLNDLKTLLVTIKGNGLARTDRLTMVGSTTVTINKPHAGSVPIALHFLAAKVTVSVKDNLSSPLLGITLTGWDVVNIPKQTFLYERTGDEQQDAVTGTRPGDYLTTAGKYNFEQVDAAAKSWSQSFYVFENRRGSRVDRELPTNPADRYPGMGKGDGNQRGKAWYAPPGATYMLIYGTHTPQEGQTNNIVYKIYLGENAVDDYNLFRGRHYGYNVTINGLDDINVDTNVEWGSASFSVDTSDNLLMDAHPDFRVFRIGGTAVNATTMAYATVEVLEPDGLTPCTWLTVSPLNLYRHGIKQAGNDRQQFAPGDGVGSFVRAKYTPTPTTESTLANSSFGMTRRLTRISFEQPAVYTYQNVILYAAALDVPETERRGKVKITYYKGSAGDEVAGQLTFEVSQQGAIQVSSNLYMERYEESGMLMHPGLASGLQGTEIMQWGYDNALLYAADDRYSNGNYLTANAVYNAVKPRNGMEAPVWVADNYAAYREKYPHQGERVREPSTLPLADGVYYYPALESSTPPSDYFHPVFNSSAARYCHEKNRDTDGDGVISKEETVWYLPSYADMVAIKKNPPTGLTGTYWTSTEESDAKSWAFTFPTGAMVTADKTTTYRVRCVRGTGTVIPDATIESEESDKTKINLSPGKGANGIFKITNDKDFGLPWTVTSNTPDWLQIATDGKGTKAETIKSGTGDATFYAYASTANTATSKRLAALTLTRAGMTAAITVSQNYFPALRGGNSNCYMVTPGSAVAIPVERANECIIELTGSIYNSTTETYYQLLSDTQWTASLVWESDKGLVSLSEKSGIGPLGHFKVTATNASAQGNAVVAIKNEKNEILWSWHIWVTTYDGTTTFTNNNGKQDFVFMDRALGALSATAGQLSSCGLMYQWGRKDPFPGIGQSKGSWSVTNNEDPILVYNNLGFAYAIPKEAVPNVIPNNLNNTIRKPDTYYYNKVSPCDWFVYDTSSVQNNNLWSGGTILLITAPKKSVFDPCPDGWRIPLWLSGTSPFATMDENWNWDNNGQNWDVTGGYFPASGYRYPYSGNLYTVKEASDIWTGTPDGTNGSLLYFTSGNVSPVYFGYRACGVPVRCCHDNL